MGPPKAALFYAYRQPDLEGGWSRARRLAGSGRVHSERFTLADREGSQAASRPVDGPESTARQVLDYLGRTGNPLIGFNVSQLLKSAVGTKRRVEVDELDERLQADLGLTSPTRGSLKLLRTPDGILVTGTLEHDVEDTCSRCLESFVRHETLDIDEEFRPIVDVSTGIELAESGDPDAFKLTSQHELDLDEAIRQYTILERPINPLCREDCRGLCSHCGANLNLGPCRCESGEHDGPRGTFGELLAEKIRQAGLKPEEE